MFSVSQRFEREREREVYRGREIFFFPEAVLRPFFDV